MTIRLAQRLQRINPSATVAMTARAIQMREAGRDVISLSVGEPDFDTPEHIKQAAIEAINAGETKYTAVDGTTKLKKAIQHKFKRDNGLSFDLNEILVSSGAKQACFNACQALLNNGDEAIIPAPYWVSYPDMVALAGASPVIVDTAANTGFLMSAAHLERALTDRTQLLILNSPSNPTGAVYARNDLESFGEVLRAYPQVTILSDDIYEHIRWTNEAFATMAAVCPDLKYRTITINGMSKAYAMSGWRVGYAAGPRELIAAMTTLQSQSTTNASSISQYAATAALVGDQSFIAELSASYKARHDHVRSRINSVVGIECAPGMGAFYLFPNIENILRSKGIASDLEFCTQLLEETGVALVPGSAFGLAKHMRISFAAPLDQLDDALDRIAKFCS